jgi:plasmid maintenance system antidote protein VapI
MLIADLHERIRQHVLATVKSGQITQTAMAESIGVQQAHMSNFLTRKRGLSIEKMDAILNALGLDVEQLVAVDDQIQVRKESSAAIESVPLIQLQAAMSPTFTSDEILGRIGFTTTLLRRLKAEPPDTRKLWVRFIAVVADRALSTPMNPRVENGSVLLIDRHYCSLDEHRKNWPNLYLIRKDQTLMVRWVEMLGSQLCLRPEDSGFPLDFISIDSKHPLESCIVGRVAHVATET